MGREDLRDQLSTHILTAQQLPLLLIQGQRRVGKTSLLNFLPQMLGSRFILIRQDLQNAKFTSITAWLQDLRHQFNQKLHLQEPEPWQIPADWQTAWQQLQDHFQQHSEHQQAKIIFALDEYEVLQQHPQAGNRLLAAIRSFQQDQNRIVFLMVGSAFLSELQHPDWSHYFVHVQTLPVDYLTPDQARRLITEPVKLDYPESVITDLIQVTQGHPHLLQALCSKLVEYANRDNRRQMTTTDLDHAVKELLNFSAPVQTVFWTQFCRDPACQATVLQLLNGEPPSDREQFRRLQLHGYLEQTATGQWQLRVPLLRRWITMYYA